jgi:hypothetical protein
LGHGNHEAESVTGADGIALDEDPHFAGSVPVNSNAHSLETNFGPGPHNQKQCGCGCHQRTHATYQESSLTTTGKLGIAVSPLGQQANESIRRHRRKPFIPRSGKLVEKGAAGRALLHMLRGLLSEGSRDIIDGESLEKCRTWMPRHCRPTSP